MRDSYPNCIIRLHDNKASKNVLKSLQFSTHCEYYLIGDYTQIESIDFPHFHINDDKLKNDNKVFYIDCSNNSFIFNSNKNSKINHEEKRLVLDQLINKKISVLRQNLNSFNLEANHSNIYQEIIFLMNFEGKCTPLISHVETEKRCFYSSSELENCFENFCNSITNDSHYIQDCIFTINVESVKNELKISWNISKYKESWEIYRSVGVNIPLIIIQNLLERKVSTFLFIEPELINIENEYSISYKLDPNKYYFDLDETLVCREKPIKKVIEYLLFLSNQEEEIILITRHIHDINETLKKINIEPSIFSKIIKVEKNQKKSEFIKPYSNSLFIDNEFPERLDVMRKCKIPVLDLDQIDFINV
jgi:hypothetical protein